ncbi:MAG TPA: AbrB/MazE/SpoVT family DNA-binding domain-containing protein [Caulobacteraceae bacterium]|jgi:antitoxin VapB|nr:AbrB/MazE/SpoVT family DNA-binding domain-containing protein [Caulobacteraceae bacterium]
MPTVTSRTFKSGNSEALRLPKEVAFGPGVEMTIVRSGDVLTAFPKKRLTTREMIEQLNALPGPGYVQERDVIEPPERPGL